MTVTEAKEMAASGFVPKGNDIFLYGKGWRELAEELGENPDKCLVVRIDGYRFRREPSEVKCDRKTG
jgi:uncharacterized protein YjeT (DUF2065 family)